MLNRVQKYFHTKILTLWIGACLPTPVFSTLDRKVAFRLLVKKLYLGIKVMSKWCQSNIPKSLKIFWVHWHPVLWLTLSVPRAVAECTNQYRSTMFWYSKRIWNHILSFGRYIVVKQFFEGISWHLYLLWRQLVGQYFETFSSKLEKNYNSNPWNQWLESSAPQPFW